MHRADSSRATSAPRETERRGVSPFCVFALLCHPPPLPTRAMAATAAQEEDLDASLYPIAVLLDELKNDDIQLRLNATRRIKTIAEALGPERTRGELLPFLTETIDDEDEVLLALAEELGDFLAHVGGSAHASVLMEPLETLSTVEETMVRDKAVDSLCILSEKVSRSVPEDTRSFHVDHMFPLVQRLGTGDWFTSRISACALFTAIYLRSPGNRPDLRTEVLSLYKTLARDETPMVRRAAASKLGQVARAVAEINPTLVREELLPIFADLVEDEQDSVRLRVVENAAIFASLLTASPESLLSTTTTPPLGGDTVSSAVASDPAAADAPTATNGSADGKDATVVVSAGDAANDGGKSGDAVGGGGDAEPMHSVPASFQQPRNATSDRIVDMVRGFSADKSWRVRYMVADQLSDLCDALGAIATRNDLLPAFVRVLKDKEPDVRAAAAFKVAEFTKRIVALPPPTSEQEGTGTELAVRDIVPLVQDLVSDSSQHVRAALASNIMSLAPVLGAELTVLHLVEVVLALLKDEFPDVRLNVISRLDKVSFIMSIDRLSSELLPAIVDLAEDKNWRVRLAIITQIPLLAEQLGRGFFEDNSKLGDLCISWLGDCVYSIREAAIANLKSLTVVFGIDWAKVHIVPQVLGMFDKSNNYLLRMTSLYAIGVLAEVVGSETVEEAFLPVVTERASRDPVPNVRFCSAKTLNLVIPYVRADLRESKIRPCLMALADSSEKDKDVNYFAEKALQKLAACS